MGVSVYDYAYAVFGIIFGIVLIANPRSIMRGAKYDEESIKTETFIKRFGILLIVISIGLGIYLYLRSNA